MWMSFNRFLAAALATFVAMSLAPPAFADHHHDHRHVRHHYVPHPPPVYVYRPGYVYAPPPVVYQPPPPPPVVAPSFNIVIPLR